MKRILFLILLLQVMEVGSRLNAQEWEARLRMKRDTTGFMARIQSSFLPDPELSRQVNFTPDPSPFILNWQLEKALDSLYRPDTGCQFTFRLLQQGLSVQSGEAFILTLAHDQWSARYFAYRDQSGKVQRNLSEQPVKQDYLDQLWQLLVQHQVLTLPDARMLTKKLVMYPADTNYLVYPNQRSVNITDGIDYRFELSTALQKRVYFYGNPKACLERFPTVEEFYHAFAIIGLIKKFVNRPCIVN